MHLQLLSHYGLKILGHLIIFYIITDEGIQREKLLNFIDALNIQECVLENTSYLLKIYFISKNQFG